MFDLLVTVNSAIMNIYVQVFVCLFLILLDIPLGVELSSHMEILCLIFQQPPALLFLNFKILTKSDPKMSSVNFT